jgi:hypothetical protein
MSITKNFGLAGIGPDVQLGKGGGRLVWTPGDSDFKFTTDGTTLAHLQVLAPVADNDAATKLYVDNVAAGLDPKEPARVATTGNITTYNASGGPAGVGQFTSAPGTIDGVTLAEGDRVLVKSQSSATQNGIYVVTATTTTWNRADDHNGTPAAEVSSGNFVFVLEGSTNAGTGWVLQGDGILTLNTDALNWVQFSASTTILAGNGLVQNGNALDLDFSELTSASTIALADELIFNDAGVESRITLTNFFNDRDIPNAITTNGLITRTADNTYASRSIAVAGAGAGDGLAITNGNGVSGDPTLEIDIDGTPALGDDVATGDLVLLYDASGTANVRATVDQLKTFMNAGTSSTSITEGNSTLSIADAGAGTLTTNIDATDVIVTNVSTTTFQNGNDVVLNTGSTLTVTDLAANRIVYTTTGGQLTSGTALTFNGTTLAATAAVDITGDLDVDNVNINGNTISITAADGDLTIQPNGTGQITLANGSGEEVLEILDTASAVNGLAITAGATGVAPTISLGTGAETNVDIGFVTNGTGVLSVVAGTGNYEDNVTADDDIPNKKYVDDAVAGAVTPGAVGTITGTVNLTSATAQNIGAADGIPANATILRAYLDVTTASDAATTVTLGDATNGAAAYMAATENDPEVEGLYIADLRLLNGGTARQARATVTTAGGTGTATAIIEFRYA